MTLNKEFEYFLRKFAHEIRNPLTTLYSTVQLIEMKHPEVKDFYHWDSVLYDIEYINQLLDELTNFSKSESLNLTSFELRPVLEQLSLSFASSIEHSEVEYTSKIDSSISQITGDKTKLQEVFRNLLKNAYEASLPGHSVYFTAEYKDNLYTFSITDTGCGIEEAYLDTIFDPFVTYKKGGNGLGLAICKNVIEAHGGTISVTSKLGIGTTFCVTLPAKQECDQHPTD